MSPILNFLISIFGIIINPIFWGGIGFSFLIVAIILYRKYSTDSISISLPFNIGSASFSTKPINKIIAWKLYVQLVTRKAVLPFDDKYDLICDVYDSMFEIFKISRELLLELPPKEFENFEGLAGLILRILNSGIRPHLTKWQAEFRYWYEKSSKLEENKNLRPQEIQRKFPNYGELVKELKETNTELLKFSDELRLFFVEKERTTYALRKRIEPEPPSEK